MREECWIRKLKKEKCIIIYGAGMVGALVYNRLDANGLGERVVCFAVSERPDKEKYLGKPVWPIDRLKRFQKRALVIVATLPALHGAILKNLEKYSFTRVSAITKALFYELNKNYINRFKECEGNKKRDIDIAFMASDNNRVSGAFLCLVDLTMELKKRGIASIVILPEYGDGEGLLQERGIDYTYIRSEHWCIYEGERRLAKYWRLCGNFRAVREMRRLIRERGIRLVHNNTTYTYVGAIAAQREGVPFVWHVREYIRNQKYSFADKKYAAKWMNRAARIITVSAYMLRWLRYIDQRKIKVLHDGVDTDQFYCKRPILQDSRQVVITLVGTVIAHKRQEELLEAANILKEKMEKGFRIRFVGKEEGHYLEKLKRTIKRYQLQDYVCFLGQKSNVADFFQESDIAVICSKAEAFGRVTVEAQLAGCVVIGADAGATAELVRNGETGLLYQAGNVRELAEQILYVAGHAQEAREIARRGQEYAKRAYSKVRNADEMLRVYEEVWKTHGYRQ